MRNFFVAAFLILVLLVVTSATPKQKCHKLSKSCSSRRKCCKGLECAPKGYKTGKRCIEKQSSPTSNEDDAEKTARNNFVMTFTGFFDAIRSKAEIISSSATRVQFQNALKSLQTAGSDLFIKAESCDVVFNENMDVMQAVQNATGATSKAAEITQKNIELVFVDTGPASAVLYSIDNEARWLGDALNDVSSTMGCNSSAISTNAAMFDDSIVAAINSLM